MTVIAVRCAARVRGRPDAGASPPDADVPRLLSGGMLRRLGTIRSTKPGNLLVDAGHIVECGRAVASRRGVAVT